MTSASPPRFNLATILSAALIAFALEPVAHEVLGHAVVAWLTGAKVILISSTAMQTQGGGRLIPAAGPLANLFFGVLACFALRYFSRFTAARLFLWFFAFSNLFLGTGYIFYSGLINFGDSAVVIAGLKPAWLYRAALIVFGAWGFRFSVRLAAQDLFVFVRKGTLLPGDVPRILYPSCIAGGLLYLVASALNPISPSLILYDGLSMAFGIALGLYFVSLIAKRFSNSLPSSSSPDRAAPSSIPFSPIWLASAAICTVLFLLFMGRGIRLS